MPSKRQRGKIRIICIRQLRLPAPQSCNSHSVTHTALAHLANQRTLSVSSWKKEKMYWLDYKNPNIWTDEPSFFFFDGSTVFLCDTYLHMLHHGQYEFWLPRLFNPSFRNLLLSSHCVYLPPRTDLLWTPCPAIMLPITERKRNTINPFFPDQIFFFHSVFLLHPAKPCE